MRLKPIEGPRGLSARLAYRASRKRLGKVVSPLTTVYGRVPNALKLAYEMGKFTESGLSLDPELCYLIQGFVARLNGCRFCIDIGQALAHQEGVASRLSRVENFEQDDGFSDREIAALRYVREVTATHQASDKTFGQLRAYFSDEEIVEITLLNAVENFWNLTNVPLGLESDGLCALSGLPDPTVSSDLRVSAG